MCSQIIKLTLSLLFLLVFDNVMSQTGNSRMDCLDKVGNSATREQLDACVSGKPIPLPKSSQFSSIDTSSEEATCLDIGFKKKTEAFASCVLDLMDRKSSKAATQSVASNDPDDATCRKYGFKPKTNEYATCRLQIDQAKQAAATQNAQYQQQQKQYLEQKRQQNIQANLALMQRGLNMMSGNSAGGYGAAPVAPVAPSGTQTYMLPNNKMLTCNTVGNITNCF